METPTTTTVMMTGFFKDGSSVSSSSAFSALARKDLHMGMRPARINIDSTKTPMICKKPMIVWMFMCSGCVCLCTTNQRTDVRVVIAKNPQFLKAFGYDHNHQTNSFCKGTKPMYYAPFIYFVKSTCLTK